MRYLLGNYPLRNNSGRKVIAAIRVCIDSLKMMLCIFGKVLRHHLAVNFVETLIVRIVRKKKDLIQRIERNCKEEFVRSVIANSL